MESQRHKDLAQQQLLHVLAEQLLHDAPQNIIVPVRVYKFLARRLRDGSREQGMQPLRILPQMRIGQVKIYAGGGTCPVAQQLIHRQPAPARVSFPGQVGGQESVQRVLRAEQSPVIQQPCRRDRHTLGYRVAVMCRVAGAEIHLFHMVQGVTLLRRLQRYNRVIASLTALGGDLIRHGFHEIRHDLFPLSDL